MKISTEIGSLSNLVGEEKAIELIAKAGFDYWDFSLYGMGPRYNYSTGETYPSSHPLAHSDYLKFARNLKRIGLDYGITCNQSHAPYPHKVKEIRDMLPRAIECTAEAGGKICVIHPYNDGSVEQNAELYADLLPFAKACGVKLATENMWDWDNEAKHASFAACSTAEDFNAVLDAVGDPYLGACLDIGHAEMMVDLANAVDMVRALGSRLIALHIHDNDRRRDSHMLPGSMQIDFPPIIAALREIGYKGDFTLEANAYPNDFTSDDAFECAKNMANATRKLADLFERG